MEYRLEGRDTRQLAVVEVPGDGVGSGEPLILEVGTEVSALGGWTQDDHSLFFSGPGINGRNRWSMFSVEVSPGASAVDLTPDDPGADGMGLLSPDGTLLIYTSERLIDSKILRYDLPQPGGAPTRR